MFESEKIQLWLLISILLTILLKKSSKSLLLIEIKLTTISTIALNLQKTSINFGNIYISYY